MKIQILSLNFSIYTSIGLWRPVQWSSKRSKLYSVYTFFTIYIMTYMFLTHLMYLIFVVENLEDFVSCSFLFSSICSGYFKMATIISRRDQIIKLIEILQGEPCKASNEEEIDIQIKFDRLIRLVYLNADTTFDDVSK